MLARNFTLSLVLISVLVAADQIHPVRQELVDQIKQKTDSWKPKVIEKNHMRHRTLESIKKSMGNLGDSPSIIPTEFLKTMATGAHDMFKQVASSFGLDSIKYEHLRLKQGSYLSGAKKADDLPANFSWHDKRPECLGQIQDQGNCGSCWAFTSAGLLSDRFCIHTDGAVKVRLSPQEMVDCNYENYGCEGGYLVTSVDYLMVEGAVSEQCFPYQDTMNNCKYRCSESGEDYDKYYCKPGTLAIAVTYEEIKRELMEHGPMLMGLMIMEDFINYDSGIYKHVVGEQIGGHAMKLVGWGTDEKEGLYWELQNQWSKDWGEEGFIRVKHGEIGIDSLAIACMPDII